MKRKDQMNLANDIKRGTINPNMQIKKISDKEALLNRLSTLNFYFDKTDLSNVEHAILNLIERKASFDQRYGIAININVFKNKTFGWELIEKDGITNPSLYILGAKGGGGEYNVHVPMQVHAKFDMELSNYITKITKEVANFVINNGIEAQITDCITTDKNTYKQYTQYVRIDLNQFDVTKSLNQTEPELSAGARIRNQLRDFFNNTDDQSIKHYRELINYIETTIPPLKNTTIQKLVDHIKEDIIENRDYRKFAYVGTKVTLQASNKNEIVLQNEYINARTSYLTLEYVVTYDASIFSDTSDYMLNHFKETVRLMTRRLINNYEDTLSKTGLFIQNLGSSKFYTDTYYEGSVRIPFSQFK